MLTQSLPSVFGQNSQCEPVRKWTPERNDIGRVGVGTNGILGCKLQSESAHSTNALLTEMILELPHLCCVRPAPRHEGVPAGRAVRVLHVGMGEQGAFSGQLVYVWRVRWLAFQREVVSAKRRPHIIHSQEENILCIGWGGVERFVWGWWWSRWHQGRH